MKRKFEVEKSTLTSLSFVVAGFIIASLFSRSALIATAFALFIAIFIFIAQKRGGSKRRSAIHGACPEMIDILISGVQSGLSLNESLSGLAQRGPEIFKVEFQRFTENLYTHGDFNRALIEVKESVAHPSRGTLDCKRVRGSRATNNSAPTWKVYSRRLITPP